MGQAAVELPDPQNNTATPASGADDLLSQMAGEHIDRMLAESDANPATSEAETTDEPSMEQLLAPAQLENETSAVAPKPAPADPPPPPAIEQPISAAEKQALAAPPAAVAPSPSAPAAAPAAQSPAPAPAYVRVLELVNAPMVACPPRARDIVGKIAILTFLNALGVLLYVLMFKHH